MYKLLFLALLLAPSQRATDDKAEQELHRFINEMCGRRVVRDPLLDWLAEYQATENAVQGKWQEFDLLQNSFRVRASWLGLNGERYELNEFYFRNPNRLSFVEELGSKCEEGITHVGIRCIRGKDGLDYWTVTTLRFKGFRDELACVY